MYEHKFHAQCHGWKVGEKVQVSKHELWYEALGTITSPPEQPRCYVPDGIPCHKDHWVTVQVRFTRGTGDGDGSDGKWHEVFGTSARPRAVPHYLLSSTKLTRLGSDEWPHGLVEGGAWFGAGEGSIVQGGHM